MKPSASFQKPGYAIVYFLFCLSTFGCQSNTKKVVIKTTAHAIVSKTNYDTLITAPCAVLVYPTLKKIDSMKKKDGEDFYTIADDNQFYMGGSISYLDSVKVKQIVKDSKGILAFRTNTGQIFKTRLDTLYWDIILFNGKDKPIHADMMIIENDYKNYMK